MRQTGEMKNNADDAKKKRGAKRVTKQQLEWLGYLLEGMPALQAGKKIGLSSRAAKKSSMWIQTTREKSSKPYLWDIWRKAVDENLRIFEAKTETIMRELCLIAFSSIDRFVELPSREKSLEFEARRKELVNGHESVNPYETIRVKYIEDIPKELIPSIASIRETKEGIEVKLHSKMDALDKLARITKLFNQEPTDEVPFGGEINIYVKGTKSPLLVSITEQAKQLPS